MITIKHVLLAGLAALTLTACGGDDGDDDSADNTDTTDTTDNTDNTDGATPDGPPGADGRLPDGPAPDSAPATVITVTCPASPDATVMTSNFMFTPAAVTINVGEIVKFQAESIHSVVPHPTMSTDPGLAVGHGMIACLQFTAAGTFHYQCSPHPMMQGTITVQP